MAACGDWRDKKACLSANIVESSDDEKPRTTAKPRPTANGFATPLPRPTAKDFEPYKEWWNKFQKKNVVHKATIREEIYAREGVKAPLPEKIFNKIWRLVDTKKNGSLDRCSLMVLMFCYEQYAHRWRCVQIWNDSAVKPSHRQKVSIAKRLPEYLNPQGRLIKSLCSSTSLAVYDIDEKKSDENIRMQGWLHMAKNGKLEDVKLQGRYILIGNPGAGKSTIINQILGKYCADCGVSYGAGLTREHKIYRNRKRKNVLCIDTPGLHDAKEEVRLKAAKEIEEALKNGGEYKVIFVTILDAGRLRHSDLVTMSLVINAIKGLRYGILINKISKKVRDGLYKVNKRTQNLGIDDLMRETKAALPDGMRGCQELGFSPELEHLKDMEGEDVKDWSLHPEVKFWLACTVDHAIEKEKVKPVLVEGQWDKSLKNVQEKHQQEMLKREAEFERRIAAIQAMSLDAEKERQRKAEEERVAKEKEIKAAKERAERRQKKMEMMLTAQRQAEAYMEAQEKLGWFSQDNRYKYKKKSRVKFWLPKEYYLESPKKNSVKEAKKKSFWRRS